MIYTKYDTVIKNKLVLSPTTFLLTYTDTAQEVFGLAI